MSPNPVHKGRLQQAVPNFSPVGLQDVNDANEEQEALSFPPHSWDSPHPAGGGEDLCITDRTLSTAVNLNPVTHVSSWSSVSLQVELPCIDSIAVEYKDL